MKQFIVAVESLIQYFMNTFIKAEQAHKFRVKNLRIHFELNLYSGWKLKANQHWVNKPWQLLRSTVDNLVWKFVILIGNRISFTSKYIPLPLPQTWNTQYS